MTDPSTVIDRTAVLAATRTFAVSVAGTPAVTTYAAAVDAVKSDPGAMKLLQDVEQTRRTIQMNPGSSDDQTSLTHLEAQVAGHEKLQLFFSAQQNLIQQLQTVNAGLTEALGFDFAAMARPACSCG